MWSGGYKLRDNFEKGGRPSATFLNTVARFINTLPGNIANGSMIFDGNTASLTCYGIPFPFRASGGQDKATVSQGYIHVHGRGGPYLYTSADVAVTGDGFLVWHVNKTSLSAGTITYYPTLPNCADAEEYWVLIAAVSRNVVSGAVSVTAQHQMGNIHLA